jgi:hypothetical protein
MAQSLKSPVTVFKWRSACAFICALAVMSPAVAQDIVQWDTGVQFRSTFPLEDEAPKQAAPGNAADPSNTTVVPRSGGGSAETSSGLAEVGLVALLTADGQRIDQGLVWRVYQGGASGKGKPKLLLTKTEPSPTLRLKPGKYLINAAFGRADLTRTIVVTPGAAANEKFVLNAGGLKLKVLVDGKPPASNTLSYDIYSGERDQFDNRVKVIGRAKPDLIVRLNAGIYRIVSTYGDANVKVEADVTVEAGKLTEALVSLSAARVTFKLVKRVGGEALPDTQWTVQTPEGQVVKRSVGALPTHILAPGAYTIIAKSGERAFKRSFTLANGETTQVEVLMR